MIGNQLLFQDRPGFGTVITNPCGITKIITVGRSLVSGIGIVKHRDHDTVLFFSSRDRRDVHKCFILDLIDDPFGYTALIRPLISRLIGKIDARIMEHDWRHLPKPVTAPAHDKTQDHQCFQSGTDHDSSHFSVFTRRLNPLSTVP